MMKSAEEMKKYPKLVDDEYYIYPDGHKTKSFCMAYEYECDWTVVKTNIFAGDYYLRHYDGRMIGPFAEAEPYKHGHFIVRKEEGGKRQYVNKNADLSEPFYVIKPYRKCLDSDGYTVSLCQKDKDGPWFFRDLDGNLSEPYQLVKSAFCRYYGIKNKGDVLNDILPQDIRQSIEREKRRLMRQ